MHAIIALLIISSLWLPALDSQSARSTGSSVLSGRVILLPNQAPAEADVSIYKINKTPSKEMRIAFLESVRADAAGVYVFNDLEAGDYLIRAELTGFLPGEAWNFHIQPSGKQTLDLGLVVTGGTFAPRLDRALSGRVESPVMEPIADATVTAINVDSFDQVFQTRTDAAGRYTIEPYRDGRYVVFAAKPGYLLSVPIAAEIPTNALRNIILQANLK
jgi:hypothetical protein